MNGFRIALSVVAGLAGCASEPELIDRADAIYHNGVVITVDGDDRVTEGVAVMDGRILAVGADGEVMRYRGEDTEMIDLAGKTVMPGFIDAHGHFLLAAIVARMANLAPPPVGDVESIDDLQNRLRQHAEERELDEGAWIFGRGYDDAMLAERRHPTREDLDAVSTAHPVFVLHVSGHIAAVNSKALELAGITADTEDPAGGHIRRVAGGMEPNGVLEEHAMDRVFKRLPVTVVDVALDQIEQTQDEYLSHGITTAQEGALNKLELRALIAAAEDELLVMDVVGYPLWTVVEEMIPEGVHYGGYFKHFRFGGVKLVLDGSPQGRTAYLSEPYLEPPEGQPDDYRGYPAMPDEDVDDFVDRFFERGFQVLAHTNGDAASDQFIEAVRKATDEQGREDRRPVMIHAQTVREDQLDRMERLGIIPSFFVSHTFFWGDWYRDTLLGPERAARISPAASASERDMRFTFHSDTPVTPPDMLRLIWSGVNRTTRSGQVLGPEQRVSVAAAIRAVTIDAAHQYFEEDSKGSIEPGKRADLVILSRNPLEVEPAGILDIEVLETIKDGQTVYRRDEAAGNGR